MEEFLREKFGEISNLNFVAEGWWSKAYCFTAGEQDYVIRIGNHLQDFIKDQWAYQHLCSIDIPIPKVLEYGNYARDLFYCISERAIGNPSDQVMEELDIDAQPDMAKIIIGQLEAIHQIDASGYQGWGFTNGKGEGMFETWQHFLSSFYNSKNPVSWQHLARTSWLNGQLFNRLIEKMKSFFPYLPIHKHILHGDFGFDNLLLKKDNSVSGVLDWAEMMLGDSLYDLVHMNEPWIEHTGSDFLKIWTGMQPNDVHSAYREQRLQCYRIHYTLFHLHIHTVREEEEEYRKIETWAINNL